VISIFEVNRIAGEKGISPGIIEKDYVLSKMLWCFSSLKFLYNNLVFKGGTVLRKFYFHHWRYSEDLDFSSIIVPTVEQMSEAVEETKTLLMDEFGVVIEVGKPHVVFGEAGKVAYIEFILKYTGPLRKSSNVKSSFRLDITCDEMVINPTNTQKSLSEYSDDKEFTLKVYSLTEILAEKLRSVLQRRKSRDYYDVWRILKYHQNEIDADAVRDVFKTKLRHREIEFPAVETFFDKSHLNTVRAYWERGLAHQIDQLPDFDTAISEYEELTKTFFKKMENV